MGCPRQILTDNGKVFTGRFGPGTGDGAVRPDLPGERDQAHPHRAAVADHDRQGRAVAQDAAPRVPRRQGVRLDRRRPGRSSTRGCSTTTTSGRISRSGWVPPIERFRLAEPATSRPSRSPSRAAASRPVDDAAGRAPRARSASPRVSYKAGVWLAGADRRGRLRRRARADPPPRRARRHPRPPAPARQADRRRRSADREPTAVAPVGDRRPSVTRKVDSSGNVSLRRHQLPGRQQLPAPPGPSRRRRRHRRDLRRRASSSARTRSATTAPASTAPSPTPAADPTASTPPDRVRPVRQVPGPKCQAGTGA